MFLSLFPAFQNSVIAIADQRISFYDFEACFAGKLLHNLNTIHFAVAIRHNREVERCCHQAVMGRRVILVIKKWFQNVQRGVFRRCVARIFQDLNDLFF